MTTAHVAALLLLQAAPAPGRAIFAQLFPFLLVFAIFYFIVFRPQQRQKQEHERRINALKKGDEIVTAGGIVGRVLRIQESIVDGQAKKAHTDRVTIESGESRLVVERGRIVSVAGGDTTTS